MKRKTIIKLTGTALLIAIIQGCGPSQADYDSIKEDNKELKSELADIKQELDDCEHGAEKLHAKMKKAFEKEDFSSCKSIFSKMENRHPDSELFTEVKSIYDKVVAIEEEKNKRN